EGDAGDHASVRQAAEHRHLGEAAQADRDRIRTGAGLALRHWPHGLASLRSKNSGGTKMKIDGGCHCGAITYEAEVDPEKTSICHCTDCQKLTGTAFRVSVRVPEEKYKVTKGTPKV